MTIQTLVSCVKQNTEEIASKMNLQTDAIVINQCDENSYREYTYLGHKICCYSFNERGVGLSRNNALLRATEDIILFSDEDIVYEDEYAQKIFAEFEKHPDMDFLLFNMDVEESRATYHTETETLVKWYNCGRYPTYSFAVRREKLHRNNITFSLLFGGGAKYSNGEDSIFIRDCLKKGMKIMAVPVTIGKEVPRPSTWFNGYNEKFFFDRGVLYAYLYGKLAKPLALRFLIKHRAIMFKKEYPITMKKAYFLMKQGMQHERSF